MQTIGQLFDKARAFHNQKEYRQAIPAWKQLIELLEAEENSQRVLIYGSGAYSEELTQKYESVSRMLALALNYLATELRAQEKYKEAIPFYEECISSWIGLKEKERIAYVSDYLGKCIWKLEEDYDKKDHEKYFKYKTLALRYYKEALEEKPREEGEKIEGGEPETPEERKIKLLKQLGDEAEFLAYSVFKLYEKDKWKFLKKSVVKEGIVNLFKSRLPYTKNGKFNSGMLIEDPRKIVLFLRVNSFYSYLRWMREIQDKKLSKDGAKSVRKFEQICFYLEKDGIKVIKYYTDGLLTFIEEVHEKITKFMRDKRLQRIAKTKDD